MKADSKAQAKRLSIQTGEVVDFRGEKFKDGMPFVDIIEAGDKVKLKYRTIRKQPDYNTNLPNYKKFVKQNRDTIFTVGFEEKHKNNKQLAYLEEDTSTIRWLFWVGHLKLVKKG